MFANVKKVIDTAEWDDLCYGKGTIVKVEHTTPFRSTEALHIRELNARSKWDKVYIPPYNIIGETNLVIKNKRLIISEKPCFSTTKLEFKVNDLFCGFYLQPKLNSSLFGYKKYGAGLYMRPILITKTDNITNGSDIIGIAGMQLLSRDNVEHNQLKPIFVRGIKRV